MNVFDCVDGFSSKEKWGNPDKMSGQVVILLEKIRQQFRKHHDENAGFVIHCGYETDGHTPNSQHYKGKATDFHIKTHIPFHKQYRIMLQIITDLQVNSYVGLGIYPDWNSPGFHLDTRGSIARWGYVGQDQVPIERAMEHADGKEGAL